MTKKAILEFFLTENELFTFIIRPPIPDLEIDDNEPILLKTNFDSKRLDKVLHQIREDYSLISQKKKKAIDCQLDDFFEIGKEIFTDELYSFIKYFDALYIVPFGALHHLPLHAMRYADKYIIDHFQIAYLPSSSILQYIQKEESQFSSQSILLGGVDSTGEEPHFSRETDQINQLPYWKENAKKYLRKKDCTKDSFIQNSQNTTIIHLSTHGYFDSNDALQSGAMMYGDYSANYIDGEFLEENDFQNILTAKDIFEKMKINADLFVLSGCVTGESEYKAGDELIGLTRALMYAGAKSMIVTLFPSFKEITSQTENSSLQFARFYEYWLGENLTKAGAFQQFICGIKINKNFSHPYNWMQYILVGNMV